MAMTLESMRNFIAMNKNVKLSETRDLKVSTN